jgi:hypothetical protein
MIMSPTITKGIIESFSICWKPVDAMLIISFQNGSSIDLMHYIMGLHFSDGLNALQSLSLNYLRHMVDFLSVYFYEFPTMDIVCRPMLMTEKKTIRATAIPPIPIELFKDWRCTNDS